MDLKDKVAIITGASSGIGRACAVRFAADGFKVTLVARNGERLAEIVQEIESEGGVAQAIVRT